MTLTLTLNLNVNVKWADWPELKELIVNAQQKLDAIAAAITKATGDLTTAIASLKAQNPTLDFSGVDAALAGLAKLDTDNPPTP